jgi:hypothetical protein
MAKQGTNMKNLFLTQDGKTREVVIDCEGVKLYVTL